MYDINFQRSVVKLTCDDYKFCLNYSALLDRGCFDTQPLNTIFNLIVDHVLVYEKEVDRNTLNLLIQEHCERKGLDNTIYELLFMESKDIYSIPEITNPKFVEDKLIEFIKRNRVKQALTKAVSRLESEDSNFDDLPTLLEDAVYVNIGGDGVTGDDVLKMLPEYRKSYDPKNLVKTGFFGYDSAMGGGLAAGELHVVIAPPKTGKSTLGSCMGSMALMHGTNVYHITLEISEKEVMSKYALRFSQLTYRDLMTVSDEEYNTRLSKFRMRKDNLFIKHYDEGTVSASTLKAWIARMRNKTKKDPGLIIIDYDDCLIPSTHIKKALGEDMYNESGSIYSELINMAKYFECPILTFSQPVRAVWTAASKGQLIYGEHISHSGRKIHRATSISSLNFAEGSEYGLLFLDLARRGESKVKVPVKRDLKRATFTEPSAEEYEEFLKSAKESNK